MLGNGLARAGKGSSSTDGLSRRGAVWSGSTECFSLARDCGIPLDEVEAEGVRRLEGTSGPTEGGVGVQLSRLSASGG